MNTTRRRSDGGVFILRWPTVLMHNRQRLGTWQLVKGTTLASVEYPQQNNNNAFAGPSAGSHKLPSD